MTTRPPPPVPTVRRGLTSPGDSLDFARRLAARAEDESSSKGERTRMRLEAAAARLLAEKGFHALRMTDVATEAGVSHGAVYRYFGNKKEIALQVLGQYSEWALEELMHSEGSGSRYQRMRSATASFVAIFAENVGLMRCMRQLADEFDEFNELWMANNRRWHRRIAEGLARPSSADPEREPLWTATALGGMVDELLHNVYVREEPTLAELRRQPDLLVDLISRLWFRAAWGRDPEDPDPPPSLPGDSR